MTSTRARTCTVAVALALAACGDDGDPAAGMETDVQTGSAGSTGSATPTSPTSPDSSGTAATSSAPTGADSDDPVPPGDQLYEEQFEGPDGSAWPSPWQVAGTQLISAELSQGRARFNSNPMTVGRMVLPGFSETDVDVAFTVTYDDYYSQGVGFYARQNGGALQQTDPPGRGYAVYVEGGYMQNFGIWRETNGVEEPLFETSLTAMPLQDAAPYRIRFQCFTDGDQTRLRARIWPAGDGEPGAWLVDITDSTPALQGTAGSFAADIYNYAGTASAYIDDVVITQLMP